MELTEQGVRSLVEQVVRHLEGKLPSPGGRPAAPSAVSGQAGVYADVDAAVQAARRAQEELSACTLETRRAMIAAMRAAALAARESLARQAVEETGMGRVADKGLKNRVAAELTPGVEDLEARCFSDDHGLTLVEKAPYGVIGSITPSTNPTETIINNAIGMVAAGNAVVFNPHPAARRVSAATVDLLNRAMHAKGGPESLLCTLAEPTIQSAQALFDHPRVNLLVVTGGPAVVRAAMRSAKKTIAAGPGNPPVVVDETADLAKAARDIVSGASFDNNIICIDEKEILAVASIADALKGEMRRHGAVELSGEQIDRITRLAIADPGAPGHEGAANKAYVGKDAALIARGIGLEVPAETRLLLCEVGRDHPLVWTEQLMPVIPLVRVASADEGIDLAVACEHGFRHTAVMHSRNIQALSRMARVMDCSLFVKNGSAYNGLGFGGAGFTSWTIASPTGEGLTRASTFTRERRCALIDSFRIV
ncbi:MAG: aldehyde dehydrogenase EutE [Thermoanaerobaculaceae bacterium]|nr:aldehyde dehydrogenase EutE [Thermoanaerobaculaceae bacterium]